MRSAGKKGTVARARPRPAGYTLVEMIMVIVILVILGSVASFVIVEATRVYARTAPATDAAWQAQTAMERMRREIRSIRTTSAADIPAFTTTSLSFIDTDGNAVTFALSGSELQRNGDVLAEGVSSLAFTYLKSDGTAASAAAEIRLIWMALQLSSGSETYSLATHLFPRNAADEVNAYKEAYQ